jgi:hypothetical protein
METMTCFYMRIEGVKNTDDRSLLSYLLNRYVGSVFLVLVAGFGVSLFARNTPWPFMELGRQTSFLLGCKFLSCIPIVVGLSLAYMYGFSLLAGNLVRKTMQ